MDAELPLLNALPDDRPFAQVSGRVVSHQAFLRDVLTLAKRLPSRRYALNLCANRYHFLVAFVAVIIRQQVNLLPPNRLDHSLRDLAADYPDSYCLHDGESSGVAGMHDLDVTTSVADSPPVDSVPMIGAATTVAILFTSGSTGKPSANAKTWGQLVSGVKLSMTRFGITPETAGSILATVPQQHMFGLECAVMMPLLGGGCLHAESPFYPDDVQQALMAMTPPRILITSPMHLKACATLTDWPAVAKVISATDVLPRNIAEQIERRMQARVFEIYGCTETGAVATRRTVKDDDWMLLDGMQLDLEDDTTPQVQGPQLPQPVVLQDIIQWSEQGRFRLLGRQGDLIKVAGKRASLKDLNLKLCSIEGVEDGLFLPPDDLSVPGARLTAMMVAPNVSAETVLNHLKTMIDPVFLPRPLHVVDHIPRNHLGKVLREEVQRMLESRR